MIREITLGQYYPVDSVLHRMDPRTKLFGTLVYIISLFIADHIWDHGIYCVPVFGEQSGCLWGGDSISGIGDSPVEGPVFLYDPGAESNPVSASDQCQL